LDFLFDDKREWNRQKRRISNGDHFLFYDKIIEYNNDNGMVDRESLRVTQKFKDEALSEVVLQTRNRDKNSSDYIHSDKIAEKQLFYGESIQNQIDELGGLLDEGHYQEITSRMKKAGFRCGFTCLFYGAPGTGKTETVLQLARQTGRDILQVDVSKIKSCWVGESEKNIKSLFDSYKDKVKKSEKAPILLFNEADAIINKRQEGAERAVDKMENSIQNIILQEMENLDGIMIATTNLAQNMDKAFERRFLYKIKFEKPTLEARMHIWHEMIPTLSEDDTMTLAEKYEFSGGQIENIARHNAINGILYGEKANSLEALMSYCDNERLETKQTRKIGF
jgi:SpoVK/Ycf46/Vps4 family AAA+-type ATPase